MILRSVWIRNNTASPLTFLGIEIAPNSMEDFSYESDLSLQTDPDIVTALLAGDISIGDGTNFASPADSLTAVLYPPISPTLAATANIPQPTPREALYRANGSVLQTFTSLYSVVQFPTVVREDTVFTYQAGGTISVAHDGWFRVDTNVAVAHSKDKNYLEVGIFHNGILVAGSLSSTSKSEDHVPSSTSTFAMIDCLANDTIEVKARARNGKRRRPRNQTTVADYCNLIIERA